MVGLIISKAPLKGASRIPELLLFQLGVDHLVIGAGVVGLAIAERLAARGAGSVLLVDKNPAVGQETSEVIHAGIYYPPNSLKTQLCIRGNELMYDFCDRYKIDYRQTGKWVVAQTDSDLEYLEGLSEKAQTLLRPTRRMRDLKPTWMIGKDEMLKQEPNVRGKAALVSPRTGIVDVHGLMSVLEARIQEGGGDVVLQCEVTDIERVYSCSNGSNNSGDSNNSGSGDGGGDGYRVKMNSPAGAVVVKAATVINSAGLHADKIYNLLLSNQSSLTNKPINSSESTSGPLPAFKLHYCKGHYYGYSGRALVSRLIYPVPDKSLAGLGTHLTLDLAGRMRFGPDVLYVDRLDDYAVGESTVGSPESLDKVSKVVQSYLPGVKASALYADYAGIRPKLAGPGEPFRDFMIHHYDGFVNLAGIESPGLTSSFAIAEYVENMLY
ncbi:hypothetical protein EDD11_001305 [Mortierella claussenii]|nr:hypothetical protein EDD11_001305 [Mortierella claussenii]